MMSLELNTLGLYARYKLMAALIVPRPIALITTLSDGGVVNAAPFSLFNMVGENPPLVMFSANKMEGEVQKDTVRNVLRSGEFVVHIADEAMGQAVHDCGHRFAPDVSELERTGLSTKPSLSIEVPYIAEAPVAFECVLHEMMESDSRYIFFGRVLWLHARDGLVDIGSARVDLSRHHPLGRMGGENYVCTHQTRTFSSTFDSRRSTADTILSLKPSRTI